MIRSAYIQLLVTLIVSFVIMYGVMFFNVDRITHVYLSLTRAYMTLLMVSPMSILMLFTMRHMYKDRKLNVLITVLSLSVFICSFIFLRYQTCIDDKQYMKGMISHHSSAIMTSKNADITDPEVKELSEKIIRSQEKEIEQMKSILNRMENK